MRPTDPPISSASVDSTVQSALAKPATTTAAPITGSAAKTALEAFNKTIADRLTEVAAMFDDPKLELVNPAKAKEFNSVVRNVLIVANLNYVLSGAFKAPDALEDGATIASSTDERMRQAGFAVSGDGKALPEIANHPAGRLAMEMGFDPDRDPDDRPRG